MLLGLAHRLLRGSGYGGNIWWFLGEHLAETVCWAVRVVQTPLEVATLGGW